MSREADSTDDEGVGLDKILEEKKIEVRDKFTHFLVDDVPKLREQNRNDVFTA